MKTKKVILSFGVVLFSVTFSFAQWSLSGNVITSSSVLGNTTGAFPLKIQNGVAQPINFWTNGTQKATILSNGNFGIGATNPANGKLIVSRGGGIPDLEISSNTGADTWGAGIRASGGTNSSSLRLMSSTGMVQLFDNTSTNYTLAIYNGTTAGVSLTANGNSYFNGGNVGIGSTTPGTKLQVTGGISATGSTGYGSFGIGMFIGGDGTNGLLYARNNAAWAPSYYDASAIYLNAQSGGNVGIGTTTPQAQLHLASNSNHEFRISRTNNTYGFRIFRDATSGIIKLDIGNTASTWETKIQIGEGEGTNTKLLLNPNGGNVGIGTTNATTKLVVNGKLTLNSSNWDDHLEITRGGFGGVFRPDNSTGNYGLRIDLLGAGSNFSVLNGNVLIGKTSQVNSIYKLDVVGSMRANEVVVNTTGADFVFDENYKLRKLEEVEKFIQENKHLPEIQSVEEMQNGGLEVGKLNTSLLQKVEEITLYIVQMNKEIQQLKAENEQLKASIKK